MNKGIHLYIAPFASCLLVAQGQAVMAAPTSTSPLPTPVLPASSPASLAPPVIPQPTSAPKQSPAAYPEFDTSIPVPPSKLEAPNRPSVSPPAPADSRGDLNLSSTGAMRSEDAYLLGSGDQLKIDMFETPEIVLEPRYQVLPDGTVNLPWIGGVTVKGLTLGQAAELLNTRYKRFIKRPTVTVSLTAPRALKIGVIGEVKRPGVHLLSLINNESSQSSLSQRSGSDAGSQWPTVSKAIQTAGGITQRGNIRNIQVRRQVAAGQSELINVDLFKFLREGDLAQDILLRDGDSLIVSELTNFDPLEATQVARSNLSPEAIRVNVVGEVVTPGSVAVPPNATLNQAILTAGGLRAGRARKNNVELIRLNPNGSVSVQKIAIDFTQDLNSKSNPPIYDNDIIVVNRNGLTKFTDNLGSVLAPVNGLFGLFSIFGGR